MKRSKQTEKRTQHQLKELKTAKELKRNELKGAIGGSGTSTIPLSKK